MNKTRRRFASDEKIAILKRYLVGKESISDLCDELNIQASQIYRWQQQLFEYGTAAFERAGTRRQRQDASATAAAERRIESLQDKLQRKNEVVAELMEEHVKLKKSLGDD